MNNGVNKTVKNVPNKMIAKKADFILCTVRVRASVSQFTTDWSTVKCWKALGIEFFLYISVFTFTEYLLIRAHFHPPNWG